MRGHSRSLAGSRSPPSWGFASPPRAPSRFGRAPGGTCPKVIPQPVGVRAGESVGCPTDGAKPMFSPSVRTNRRRGGSIYPA
eukprot:9115706-Pyramimonas_sp.AAC.1